MLNSFTGENWRIQVLSEALVRFEWDEQGIFVDEETQLVVSRTPRPAQVRVERLGTGVRLSTAHFRLDYDGQLPTAAGLSVKARGSYHSVWRYGLPLVNPFAELFARPINLGGTTRTLDTVDGRYPLDDGVLSDLGIAVLDDSASFALHDDFRPPRPGHVDVYIFTHGRDHQGALEDLARLTGPIPLIPRYALGNWWSRFHRYSAESYLVLLDRFADHRIPISVAVLDMDWHLTDIPERFGSGWTGYTWNRELFPNPPAFLTELHRRGLAVTLNVHPADGIRPFEDAYPRVCELLGLNPADEPTIDFDLTDPAFTRAYFEAVHHPLEKDGVDFWWIDWQQGELSPTGIDPLWLLNRKHTDDLARRGKRPLILSRYAGPGSHRFPVGFSGDTVASWESLAFQPEFTATAANIGFGTWSHDIGGHLLGVRDDELALRWLQFGVFSPINRLHSSDDEFSGKEPWKFRPEICAEMAALLRLRHGLVPYLYTEWATGKPLVRPMYHAHPEAELAYEVPNQYAFGSQLIVAPITSRADEQSRLGSVQAWLPEGRYVDVFTGQRYVGNRLITLHRDLSSLPVLASDGAIIPLAAEGTPAADLPEEFEVWVAPGKDGYYTIVEDDGALNPRTVTTELHWSDAQRRFSVAVASGATDLLPTTRRWQVRLLGEGHPPLFAGSTTTGSALSWYAPAPDSAAPETTLERCRRVIEHAQCAAAAKSAAMRIVSGSGNAARKVQALRETPVRGISPGQIGKLPDSLVAALSELLIAEL